MSTPWDAPQRTSSCRLHLSAGHRATPFAWAARLKDLFDLAVPLDGAVSRLHDPKLQ